MFLVLGAVPEDSDFIHRGLCFSFIPLAIGVCIQIQRPEEEALRKNLFYLITHHLLLVTVGLACKGSHRYS